MSLKQLNPKYQKVDLNDELTIQSSQESLSKSEPLEIVNNISLKYIYIAISIIYLISFIGLLILAIQVIYQNNELKSLTNQLTNLNNEYEKYKLLSSTQWSDHDNRIGKVESSETKNDGNFKLLFSNITNISYNLRNNYNEIKSISSTLIDHTNQIIKLSNTSNAEVLDKLKETKLLVSNELSNTKKSIFNTIESSSKNITVQMNKSKEELNNNLVHIQNYMNEAKSHIYQVENNVTSQLNDMSVVLTRTINDLNKAVEEAQKTIHHEVDVVRSDIDVYVAATNKQFAVENDFVKYQLAGIFTLLGCLISLWHMTSHWRHFSKPSIQRRVTAVLWMVPIYGITSWLALVIPSLEFGFGAFRDCFEAYVVYTFIGLLIAILEDDKGPSHVIELLTEHVVHERDELSKYIRDSVTNKKLKRPSEHLRPPFPCCYVNHRPSSVASAWLNQNKLMVMQFVFMKPLLTMVPLILMLSGIDYDSIPLILSNHSLNWRSPRLYLIFFQNFSVGIAFYGLLSFYHGTEKDLAWCDPWPKFLCIKGVVFMTFWQGIVLQVFSWINLIDSRTASQLQNLLICIEMLLASLAHFYIFPYHEWQEGYQKDRESTIAIRDTLAIGDFVTDLKRVLRAWDTTHQVDKEIIKIIKNVDKEHDLVNQHVINMENNNNLIADLSHHASDSEFEEVDIETKPMLRSINPLFPDYFSNKKYYQLSDSENKSNSSIKSNDSALKLNEHRSRLNPLNWLSKSSNNLSSTDKTETIGLLSKQQSDDSAQTYSIELQNVKSNEITFNELVGNSENAYNTSERLLDNSEMKQYDNIYEKSISSLSDDSPKEYTNTGIITNEEPKLLMSNIIKESKSEDSNNNSENKSFYSAANDNFSSENQYNIINESELEVSYSSNEEIVSNSSGTDSFTHVKISAPLDNDNNQFASI